MAVNLRMSDITNITYTGSASGAFNLEVLAGGFQMAEYDFDGTGFIDTATVTEGNVIFSFTGTGYNIANGDTITITYDGGQTIAVDMIAITAESEYYMDTNGAFYSDEALLLPESGSAYEDSVGFTEILFNETEDSIDDTLALAETISSDSEESILDTVTMIEKLSYDSEMDISDNVLLSENIGTDLNNDISDNILISEVIGTDPSDEFSEIVSLIEDVGSETYNAVFEETVILSEDLGAEDYNKIIDDTILISELISQDTEFDVSDTIKLYDIMIQQSGGLELTDQIRLFDKLSIEKGYDILETIHLTDEIGSDKEYSLQDEIDISDVLDIAVLYIDMSISLEDAILTEGDMYYLLTETPFNLGQTGIKLLTEIGIYGNLPESEDLEIRLSYKSYGATAFSHSSWRKVGRTGIVTFYQTGTEFYISVRSLGQFKPDTIRIKWKNVDNRNRRDHYVGNANTNTNR